MLPLLCGAFGLQPAFPAYAVDLQPFLLRNGPSVLHRNDKGPVPSAGKKLEGIEGDSKAAGKGNTDARAHDRGASAWQPGSSVMANLVSLAKAKSSGDAEPKEPEHHPQVGDWDYAPHHESGQEGVDLHSQEASSDE